MTDLGTKASVSGSQKLIPRPAASTPPEKYFKKQMLWLHPRPQVSYVQMNVRAALAYTQRLLQSPAFQTGFPCFNGWILFLNHNAGVCICFY